MYPHSATPRIPTQSPYNTAFPTYRIRPARQTPLSSPSTNSHPPYLPYSHPTQLHSRVNSTPTNSTRPSTISKMLRTLSHKQIPPYPLPTRPTPTPQPDPTTPPYPPHILSHPPNPHPSYPYMPTPPQRLSSVLARCTCH